MSQDTMCVHSSVKPLERGPSSRSWNGIQRVLVLMAVRVHCYRYLRLFRYSSLGTRGSCEPVFRGLCRMHLVPCSDRPGLGRSYHNRLPNTRRGQYDDCVEERRWGIFTRCMLQMCHTSHCSNWALSRWKRPLEIQKHLLRGFKLRICALLWQCQAIDIPLS